jgi:uncharacterized protein (DUF58 family)
MDLRGLADRSQAYQFWRLFSGRAAPDRGPVFLSQRRVYILPTRHGVFFAAALALMLIGSINYQLSLGFILTFLLAGMGVVAILHTFRNLAHLTVSAGRVEPAFAGGAVRFHLHLDNAARFDRVAIDARCGAAAATVDVPARGGAAATLALPATRRGWLRLPRVTVETRYPVGLFRAWSYVQPDARALVYPRPDQSTLPLPTFVPDRGDAAHAGVGSDDFAALRPYQLGDSPRHIAWKSAARGGQLLTKVFTGRGAAELWLDFGALPAALGVEGRLSRLTRQVLLAEEAHVAYGLRLPDRELGPDLGESHCDACLKALALFQLPDERGVEATRS